MARVMPQTGSDHFVTDGGEEIDEEEEEEDEEEEEEEIDDGEDLDDVVRELSEVRYVLTDIKNALQR